MAKNPPEDKGKVKFRFVEFELEGLNSTIEESIKSIVQSMNRGSTTPYRIMSVSKPVTKVLPAGENGHLEVEPEPQDMEGAEIEEQFEETKTQQSKEPRRYTQPKFLSDLDLDSGSPSFKEFAEQQAPKSNSRKYLVIAAWLKKNRNTDVISPDHIYTCNQKMGWKTLKDVGQPFRYMKRKSFFDTPGRNQWKLTHIGLDQLNTAEEE